MRPLCLHIEGMSCGHCLNAVNQALSGLTGVRVKSVRIGRAEVEYDEGRITPTDIVAAIGGQGYRATPQAEGVSP